jgi:hypothetical protein
MDTINVVSHVSTNKNLEVIQMAKYNNETVIKMFFQGNTNIESHTGNLWISNDGKRLMNYATCLAERSELGLIINRTSYSNTTSKIQSQFIRELNKQYSKSFQEEHTIEVDNVDRGTAYLVDAAHAHIEWSKGIKQIKVINYFDVWGNKKDGWEINNMCVEETLDDELLQLHESASSKDAFQLLKDTGFFKKTARINQVDIDNMGEFGFEFHQRKDGMPICRIEFINN